MDNLERNGLANAAAKANRKINLNTPITDNPELEQIRQGLQRDYSTKTEEAATVRRQAEQMMQQAQYLLEQARQTSTQRTQTPQTQREPLSVVEAFERKFGGELDAPTRQTLSFLEEHFGSSSSMANRELDALKQQMSQMQALLTQSTQVMRAMTAKPELDSMTNVLGEDELRKRLPMVSEIMNANPNLTFKQALAAADPDFFAQQMGKHSAETELQRQRKEQDRIMALLGGGVEGMIPEPGGGEEKTPEFSPGEDFNESVRKLLGEGGYRQLIQNEAMGSS